jgi:hypothetical protein
VEARLFRMAQASGIRHAGECFRVSGFSAGRAFSSLGNTLYVAAEDQICAGFWLDAALRYDSDGFAGAMRLMSKNGVQFHVHAW